MASETKSYGARDGALQTSVLRDVRDGDWQCMAESSTGQPKPAAAKAKEGSTWQAKGKQPNLCTPCGEKHEWVQWTEYVKHCKKFRCEREGCGYFKKCWTSCENIDCKGCHVPAHKRW